MSPGSSIGGTALRIAAVVAVIGHASSAQCSFSWDPRFGVEGIDGIVYSATTFDDGTGPALYLGGDFAVAETASGANVAKRVGSHWIAPGGGIPPTQLAFGQPNPPVTSFAGFDDGNGLRLHAARLLVYRLNGPAWTPITSATSGIHPTGVNALRTFNDGTGNALYAAGHFVRPGGSFSGVARWNGTNWLQVGGDFTAPLQQAQMNDLVSFTDQSAQTSLYVAGLFDVAGGVAANSIARWTGAAWAPLGTGVTSVAGQTTPGRIYDLHVWNDGLGDQLYACGTFTHGGGLASLNLVRWSGTTWSSIGSVVTANYVFSLGSMVVGGIPTLFVGGSNLQTAGGVPVTGIAAYNGIWSNPGGGITSTIPSATMIWVIHAFDDGNGEKLYAGGRFNRPGNLPNGENITTWDGATWARVDSTGELWGGEQVDINPTSSSSPIIQDVKLHDDGSGPALFVTGWFNRIGGVAANCIAKLDSQGWHPLGSGLNNAGTSLEVFDDGSGPKLYVGGWFGSANGVSAFRLARWNGTTFSAVPGFVSSQPTEALAVYDDGTGPALWVGRACPFCPPGPSNALMKWTPAGFVPFPQPIAQVSFPPTVHSLEVLDWGLGPRLVVGGRFDHVGGAPCSTIFAWDGSTVDTLGGGFGPLAGFFPVIRASAVFSGPSLIPRLVAGGLFGSILATGQPTKCVAQWNGAQWLPIGSGVDQLIDQGPEVYALCAVRDTIYESLYVGGRFLDASGVPVSNLARWDGAGWSNPDAGVRFVGKALRAWVDALEELDLGAGPSLVVAGAFNTAGPAVGAGLLALRTPSRPSIGFGQPAPGAPVTVIEQNLIPGQEYFSIFSLQPCGGGPGTGPYVGLCTNNLQSLLDQINLPAGAVPFHFIASASTEIFGPFPGIPPLVVDAINVHLTPLGCPSQVTRFTVQ
jgi:Domain of unknown function (DUF5122) beta-propeller